MENDFLKGKIRNICNYYDFFDKNPLKSINSFEGIIIVKTLLKTC